MVLDAKVVTYTANTGTGNQDLTGTTFTPKAAIVWFTRGNNAADTFVEGYSLGYGFTDGTNSRCVCNVSEDAQASSDAARILRNDSIIVVLNPTGTLTTTDAQASFVQWNADGMRINWSDAPAAAFKFHVLYLGGADLTNVKVGDITITGNGTAVGFAGVGFRPNLLLMVGGHNLAVNSAAGTGASFTLGCWGSTTFSGTGGGSGGLCVGVASEQGRTTMDTWQFVNTGAPWIDLNATTGAFLSISSVTSLDSDGFSLTTSNFSVSTIRPYLALRGPECFTALVTEPGSTGLQNVEDATNMNNGGKAVMLFGVDRGTVGAGTVQVDNVFSFGAATAVAEQAVTVVADLDAALDSVTTSRYQTSSIYLNITPTATATSSTIDDEATLSSFTNSGCVINWTNIGNARVAMAVVLGNIGAAAVVEEPPRAHSYGTIQAFDNNMGDAIFGAGSEVGG